MLQLCCVGWSVDQATLLFVWLLAGHGMEWNENFGMEYGRCQNEMERKISRMKWKTIFHTNSILHFVHFLQKNTYRCWVVIKNRKALFHRKFLSSFLLILTQI